MIFFSAANAELESDWELVHASLAYINLKGWDYHAQFSSQFHYSLFYVTGCLGGCWRALLRHSGDISWVGLCVKKGKALFFFHCVKAVVIKHDRANLLLGLLQPLVITAHSRMTASLQTVFFPNESAFIHFAKSTHCLLGCGAGIL